MYKKFTIISLCLLLLSCNNKNNKSDLKIEEKTEKVNDSIFFKNIIDVVNDKKSTPWVKSENDFASCILYFNLENLEILAIQFTPECWAYFPIEIKKNKIIVYWDVNIDTKYNFDIVKTMNKIDESLKGKPFIILELRDGKMLKASYEIEKLREELNNGKENYFANEFYATTDLYK
ncbi:hypothetical protein [Flavobacterium sp.]|uniref:hypothetical protein n=1 Tax=Flavobacterium sp. TaxID=239 RepID=UPI0037522BE3